MILTLWVAWPTAARGQHNLRKVPTLNFEPSVSTEGLLTVESSKTLGHLRFSLGLYVGYANDPLQTSIDDRILYRAVAHQLVMDVVAALGITKYLELGVHFPVVWWQGSDGTPQLTGGATVDDLKALSIGDLRIVPKIRFWTKETSRFGLALIPQFTIPTGFADANTGEQGLTFEPKLVLDYRFANGVTAAVNVGYRLRKAVISGNLMVDDEFLWGLGVEVPIWQRTVSVVAEIGGAVGFKDVPDAIDKAIDLEEVPLEALGAIRYRAKMGLMFTLGAGVGATNGYGTPDFRVFMGLGYAPPVKGKVVKPKGPKDTDGDGLLDPVDKCPLIPEDFDGFEDKDGCPEPDNDKDGICDPNPTIQKRLAKYTSICKGSDKCPLIPEDKDGFEDQDGCPDPDNDKDGICDPNHTIQKNLAKYSAVCKGSDKCPLIPEDKDGFEDEDGCPDPDNDKDKVCDPNPTIQKNLAKYSAVCKGSDKCPLIPEDIDGFEDDDGCPDPDNDKDGICDKNDTIQKNKAKYSAVCRGFDQCPLKKETINGIKDEDGCPDKGKVLVSITENKLMIMEKIYFAYNKATIRPRSYHLLKVVAQTLNDHAYIQQIRIEGHTDRRGGYKFNIRLSQRRTDSVRRFLVKRGKVAPTRLITKGFGYNQPRNKNCKSIRNRRARKKCFAANRRVEFIILKRGK